MHLSPWSEDKNILENHCPQIDQQLCEGGYRILMQMFRCLYRGISTCAGPVLLFNHHQVTLRVWWTSPDTFKLVALVAVN